MNDCTSTAKALSDAESIYKKSEESYREAEHKYNSVRESIKGIEKDIVDVLEKAKDFLAKYPTVESCPVCEKPENAKELTDKIDKRLTSLKSLIEAKKVYETAKNNLDVQKKILLSKKSDWIGKVRDLASFVKDASILEIDSLKITWTDFAAVLSFIMSDDADIAAPIAKQLWEKLLQSRGAIESRKQREEKEVNQLTLIKTSYKTFIDKNIQSKRLEKQLEKLKKLHERVEKERKAFVENELSSISGVVDSLYANIHPAEGLGKVKFYLNPQFIGSLVFTGQFQGTSDVQPQAYYSESHLDTLGVCVFLALAKKYSDENTVIILDDVITSIDQAHMTRFINMLHDEADNFNQLIITTHYRPWKDRYKYYGGPTANVQLIELLHWSHSRGIRHTKAKLSVEELEEYLQDKKYDRQIVANKAGVLLEGLIDHIALRYNCRLPRKAEPDYTLGELLSSIESKLKKALSVHKRQTDGTFIPLSLEPILEEIKSLSWIRNEVGCHLRLDNNTSDTEVELFGEITVKLAKVLICNGCGELPYRDKSGSYWECRCGSAQMHPHKIPS
jgi:wobble nucleotide-excising tRNase